MGIAYSQANNKITITGFSALTPCNFTGLWTEDKIGTLELMPATTPALNMTLTTQVRPADEVVLKIDFILASSGAGAGDTIIITGLDKDGSAQSETIDVSGGDATYGTTKWFKTITDIDCHGFNSGTLTVRQNQWGVVWKNDNQFKIDAHYIDIGNGSADTWFADENKQITFDMRWLVSNGQNIINVKNHATFRLGKVEDVNTKATEDGCQVFFLIDGDYYVYPINQLWNSGPVYLYGTTFKASTRTKEIMLKFLGTGSSEIWNCFFEEGVYINGLKNIDLYNLDFVRATSTLRNVKTGVTAERISGMKVRDGVYFIGSDDMIIKDIWARDLDYGFMCNAYSGTGKFINADIDNWNINWYGTSTGLVYRQYTLNLKVIDKDGNPITTAKVKVDYKTGVCFVQEDVDANGNLVADKAITKGFYNQANGNNLVYQEAGFDYEYIDLEVKAVGYVTHKERFSISEKMTKDANIVKLNRIGLPPAMESHNV